jgi:hypothetical protein
MLIAQPGRMGPLRLRDGWMLALAIDMKLPGKTMA